jgi:hypothetical protein
MFQRLSDVQLLFQNWLFFFLKLYEHKWTHEIDWVMHRTHLPSRALWRLPWQLLTLLWTLPALLLWSSTIASWVEEACVDVPWVEVPLDFLIMGVFGSLRSDWAKSGSWSTCRLSFTILDNAMVSWRFRLTSLQTNKQWCYAMLMLFLELTAL